MRGLDYIKEIDKRNQDRGAKKRRGWGMSKDGSPDKSTQRGGGGDDGYDGAERDEKEKRRENYPSAGGGGQAASIYGNMGETSKLRFRDGAARPLAQQV